MNIIKASPSLGKELQLLRITVRQTQIFLNIQPAHTDAVGSGNLAGRMKYWGEIGAFYGGMLGIFCGFMLSFVTNIGSFGPYGMLLCWAGMCLAGAIVVGNLSSFFVRLLQFKPAYHGPLLAKTAFQAVRPV
jgi:hypothetical protein